MYNNSLAARRYDFILSMADGQQPAQPQPGGQKPKDDPSNAPESGDKMPDKK